MEAQAGHRDAESRAAAVRALSTVAYELFPISANPGASSGGTVSGPEAAAVLETYIIRPLLEAAQDYCTDDRCSHIHSFNVSPAKLLHCALQDFYFVGIHYNQERAILLLIAEQALLRHGSSRRDLGPRNCRLYRALLASSASTLQAFSFPALCAGVMWVAGSEKQPS